MVEASLQLVYTLFDELPDGACLADEAGNAFYMNPAAVRLLDLKDGDKTRVRNVCELLCGHLETAGDCHAADGCPLRMPSEARAASYLGRHGPHEGYHWRGDKIKRKDSWRNLRVRCLRTRLPLGGRAEEVRVVFIEDASVEMELRQHKADWRGMIAHDLRAPLTSIFAGLRLLQEAHPQGTEDSQEPQAKLVEMSLKGCQRMIELLDLYLDVSRLDAQAMPARLEPVELAPIVAEAVSEQASLAAALKVRVDASVPAGLKARGDADMLKRVLVNLLNNGLKYNVEGGAVKIGIDRQDEALLLSVSNTGPGIGGKDLPFIFDRYYQAEARRAGRIKGNGLGLTFCKEALRLMEGAIDVSSKPGATEFVVRLKPAAAAAPSPRAPAAGGVP